YEQTTQTKAGPPRASILVNCCDHTKAPLQLEPYRAFRRSADGDVYVDDGGTIRPPRGGEAEPGDPNSPDQVTLITLGAVHDPAFVIQTIADNEYRLNSMRIVMNDLEGVALSGEHMPTDELTSNEFDDP